MPFVKRNVPRKRLKDYRKALKKWLGCTLFDSIVFCENSGYDLSKLSASASGRVTFLSFSGNNYPRHFGKGYGEMNILRHVLSGSVLRPHDLIVKVTGRYYVRNAAVLVAYMKRHPDCEVFCDIAPGATSADSRMFAGSVRFLEDYVVARQNQVNDTARTYFEHVLAEAVLEASLHGLRCSSFPEPPAIEGISGTFDRSWNRSTWKRCWDWVTTKIWYSGLALTKPIRRRIGLDERRFQEIRARFQKVIRS